jgi:hypothetical protein
MLGIFEKIPKIENILAANSKMKSKVVEKRPASWMKHQRKSQKSRALAINCPDMDGWDAGNASVYHGFVLGAFC